MRRLIGAGLVAAALLITSVPALATGPGRNGKLVYTTAGGLVVADANGANAQTIYSGTAYEPVWSPDGLRIAASIGGDIWAFDADGGGMVQVTSGGDSDETPSWSPDGTKIVFGRWLPGNKEAIMVVAATGGTVTQLSKPANGYYDFSPAWSPDGKRIAFNRDKGHGTGSYDIFLMNPNGKNVQRWIIGGRFNGYPTWSPDSKRIAYEQGINGKIVLRTRAASGGAYKTLTTKTAWEPEYSPDGTHILYMDGTGKVRSIPVNGGTAKVVISVGGSPGWQPVCNKTAELAGSTVTGTAKAELLCGGPGPDTIKGGGGNDHLFGFAGNDILKGEAGNDTLVGGEDTDSCIQGPGTGARVACES